ncbi:hypothetical protein DYBT9623_01721 [Dyadobacter sp. CECT 9623]|uniref:Uncharacterized protein n=2 Tax=Dyadobacter linearis TaxID=2823330 RepID=A0ABN7R952_9BACT|nr:hypothetical protein DYBT9623_01721 [Dyadobacter sp. CECT 9623]
MFSLINCKESDKPLPLTHMEANGIFEFKVYGVPQENISTLAGGSIIIKLPADYQGGNKIKVSFKNWEKKLSEPWPVQMGWKNGSINYEGNEFAIPPMEVRVIPNKPLEILSNGKPYVFPISGMDLEMKIFVKYWGTKLGTDESDNQVRFSHNTSGKLILSQMKASPPDTENSATPVSITIPRYLEVGDYTVEFLRGGKAFKLSDVLTIEYGEPLMAQDYWPNIVTDSSRTVSFAGYNFLSNHTYELVLSNDFSESRRLKLSRHGTNILSVNIPENLIDGNYVKEILIDGRPTPLDNLIKAENIVIVQNSFMQPRLMSLTHMSQKYTTPNNLDVVYFCDTRGSFLEGSKAIAVKYRDG